MITLDILPSKIYKFEYDDNKSLKTLVDDLKVKIIEKEKNNFRVNNARPKTIIFDCDEYPTDFNIFLTDCIKFSLLKEKIKYKNFKIILNWMNLHEYSENIHGNHVHPNSIYSGVYYYETVENDSIVFYENDQKNKMIYDILKTDFTAYYSKKQNVPVKDGELLIFRSYFEHGVDKFYLNGNDRKRISFSFNVDLSGIGSTERLTYR